MYKTDMILLEIINTILINLYNLIFDTFIKNFKL